MALQDLFAEKSAELQQKRTAYKAMADAASELPADKVWDHIKSMESADKGLTDLNDEVIRLQSTLDSQRANDEAVKRFNSDMRAPATPRVGIDGADTADDAESIKSLADLFKNAGVKHGFRGIIGDVQVKSTKTLSTTADMIGQNQRLPLILDAQEERTTADLMLQGTTSATTLEYYEETTFTNAAAEVSEAGLKPESAIDFTLITEPVRKIATWLPVTDEMMADNEGFDSYLRQRLGFMIRQREEQEILVGDGTAPNISGILDRSGIQTQAKGADDAQDAIFYAIQKVRTVAFAEPTAIVLHPNDWTPIRLARTADGIYLMGGPQEAGDERLWGKPLRLTSNITEGTGLVGAFRPDAQLFRKGGVQLAVSDSHDVYFIYNKLAVRIEERVALAVYRPASFCKVTGI